MKAFTKLFGTAALSAVVCLGTTAAQDAKKDTKPAPDAQAGEFPKPGPEQAVLKQDEGSWDATIETRTDAAEPPQVSKGVETNTMMGGGLWLIQNFKGDMGGMPFEGHGVAGFDANKKKYVGTWVDSMSPSIMPTEGTYDSKKKLMSSTIDSIGPDGKPLKLRSTMEYKSDGQRVFTMYMPGPDGKDFPMMKITYKRRSASAGAGRAVRP
jgi:hypothetical protein